jgi:uncharacterized RDD family membrane protein YckC
LQTLLSKTTEAAVSIATGANAPAYARFTRRVQGVYIDLIILLVIATSGLITAVAFKSDYVSRVLGFTVAISWLLYEPLLVSLTGATLGHRYCNIRVVDERHGGNVSFVKAVARVIIKIFLGWYSFVSMAATSRHQALHDLLTGSTVQIRNLAKAKPHHFASARTPLPSGAPSRVRRITVIVGYLVVWISLGGLAYAGLFAAGALSDRCLYNDVCSVAERWIDIIITLILLAVSALLLGRGWRGKLWGARIRQVI